MKIRPVAGRSIEMELSIDEGRVLARALDRAGRSTQYPFAPVACEARKLYWAIASALDAVSEDSCGLCGASAGWHHAYCPRCCGVGACLLPEGHSGHHDDDPAPLRELPVEST